MFNQFVRTMDRQDLTIPLDANSTTQEEIDHPSMVNAIIRLPESNWVSSRGQSFSEVGFARLKTFGMSLQALMQQIHLPIPTLIRQIEKTTGLGIEVAVRPGSD